MMWIIQLVGGPVAADITNLVPIVAVSIGLLALYWTVRHARACSKAQGSYLWRLLGLIKQGANRADLPAKGECPAHGSWDIALEHGLSATLTLSPLGKFQVTLWSRRFSWAWGGRRYYGSASGSWHFKDGFLLIPAKGVPDLVVGAATGVSPESFQFHTAAGSFLARRQSP